MNGPEQIRFLSNLLVAATSDGTLTAAQETFVENIRKELKAKKSELKQAQNEAAVGSLDVTSFQLLSTAIRNVEEIGLLLLSTTNTDLETSPLMADAIQALKLGEEASRLLLEGVRTRHSAESGICWSCNAKNDTKAKFCSSCGAPLDGAKANADAVATELTPAKSGVTVAFAESGAAGFPDALAAAQNSPTFQKYKKGSKLWYAASFSLEERSELHALVKHLKGMRNREVYIDGGLRQWDACFRFTYCAVRRESSFRPAEFCFGEEEYNRNCWGCSQLQLPWAEWSEWFTWGRFVDEKTFEFDLPRIEHELKRQKQSVDLCPYFRENFFDAVLKSFPQRVEITPDGDWDYQEGYGRSATSFEVKVRVDYGDGDVDIETREVNGVTPKTRKPALDLMKAAARASGIPIDDLPSR